MRGRENLKAKTQALTSPAITRAIDAALFAGAERIAVAAQISITAGAVSGKEHVPSLPGEAPNNDTGILANNIEAARVGPLRAMVSSNAPYSAPLEFGTSKMEARPFMRPARDRERKAVRQLVATAVNRAVKGVVR